MKSENNDEKMWKKMKKVTKSDEEESSNTIDEG